MSNPHPPTTHRFTPAFRQAGDVETTRTTPPNATPRPIPREPDAPQVRGYELIALVGTGGMGVVYRARHRELGRTVALKMLRGAALDDPEYRDRFRAEAEAVARLQHPNIIQVFEVGTADAPAGGLRPAPYIVFEFVEGGSLAGKIDAPWSPRDAAKMVEKLARAAHAAHGAGVVHRDLKPANVLLTPDGEPKIADFGVSKQLDAGGCSTRAGVAVGTPEYMAPEQVTGGPPTPAIDTYALGVILYELLTGRRPHRGPDAPATMDLVRDQEPVAPRRLQPGLPRDLDTICLKCLEKSPGRRYETAGALADDLARWADGRTIRARPVGPAGRSARWASRNPTVAGLSLTLFATALVGVGGIVWKWQEARRHAEDAAKSAQESRNHADAERWERYRAEIVAAMNSLRLNDARNARRTLSAAPAEHRGWEWRYAKQRLDDSSHTFDGGATGMRALAVTGWPGVAIAAGDKVHVWEVATGRRVASVADRGLATRFTMDAAGTMLACQPDDELSAVRIWDVASGQVLRTLRGHAKTIWSVRFSPDGRRVAASDADGAIKVWDVATGREVLSIPNAEANVITFDADGRRFVCAGRFEGKIRVWDAETGRLTHLIGGDDRKAIWAAFSPDGNHILAWHGFGRNDGSVWSLATGLPVCDLAGHRNVVTASGFSPDGRRIATASLDQTARLWDAATGRPIAELRGHAGRVFDVAFSPDGTRVATAAEDHTLRLWDGLTGEPLAVAHGHVGEVLSVAWTGDGSAILTGAKDGTVKVWDAERLERGGAIRGHTNYVYGVSFHPDGRRAASASWDGTVRLWDVDSGREVRRMTHKPGVPVVSVAFRPDGKTLASLGRDGVRLWDVESGAALHHWAVPTHNWIDSRIAFHPAGRLLAAGGSGGEVRLLDVTTKAEVAVLRGHKDAVRDVAFSPDGRWLATGADNGDPAARIWDAETFAEVAVLKGHSESVYSLAFSPDSATLASGSTDGTIRLWDCSSWKEAAVLKTDANVYGLAFTPKGCRLAAGCADDTIRLYDVATRHEVGSLSGHTDYVHSVAFSPDGTRLVSGSGDTTLRIWDTLSPGERQPKRP